MFIARREITALAQCLFKKSLIPKLSPWMANSMRYLSLSKRPNDIILLYGSESGNAENLTKQLKEDLERRGIDCEMMPMNDMDVSELKETKTVLFITSTAGQGVFPSNATDFFNSLSSETDPTFLKDVNCSVFGLGDHGYVFFNKAAMDLSSKLSALGANQLIPSLLGDDRDDEKFETKYYEWLPSLYEALHCEKVIHDELPKPRYTVTVQQTINEPTKHFKPLRSHILPVTTMQHLTKEGYDRDIRHFEVDLTGTKIKYKLGDTLGIYPQNSSKDVQRLLKDLGLNGSDFVKIQNNPEIRRSFLPSPTDLTTLFTEVLDVFGRPTRRFYSMLGRFAIDETEKAKLGLILTKEGNDSIKGYVNETATYADILRAFPSAKPSLPFLLDMIPTMKPRYYSIASSPLLHPSSIHLCIVGVDWITPAGIHRSGQCSSYMHRLSLEHPISIRAAVTRGTMHMPEKTESPVIMAGLGTGIAPFKAITENRVAQARAGNVMGDTILFYGCRYEKEFVYHDLWKKYQEEGILTHVIPAFSREQKHKIYVQDRIRSNSQLVFNALMKQGGYFYYCGLAGRAPAEIRQGLIDAFVKETKMSEDKADEYLIQMEKEGRYNLECW